MAFLGKGRKNDLMKLAEVLEVPFPTKAKLVEIKELITSSERYDEEFVSNLFDSILRERQLELEREEREKQLELEREEREKQLELEREEREKQKEIEREQEKRRLELKNKEMELNFELEKLKLEKGIPSTPDQKITDPNSRAVNLSLNLKKLIPEFDARKTDISLYLVLFERQMKRTKIDPEFWLAHLISLLPVEIAQVIAREPEEKSEDYSHIKKILLERFKLSPEVFRQKFVQHQKRNEDTWKDFSFELKNYLEEWLTGLKVTTLDELKDLMVVDQLKKRVRTEMKEHFLDKWSNFKSTDEIIRLFDDYDNVRSVNSKQKERGGEKYRSSFADKKLEFAARDSRSVPTNKSVAAKEKAFERRVGPRCYVCDSPDHIKPFCPKLQKNKPSGSVNNIQEEKSENLLDSFSFRGSVNGREIKILRDSGSTLDVCARKYIRNRDFCGEKIWVKQPLSLELICLPLAIVEISGDFGTIQTKAAVCGNQLDQNRYLLGNKTAALIKEKNGYDFFQVEQINAVQTRAQSEKLQREKQGIEVKSQSSELASDPTLNDEEKESICVSPDVGDPISIPALEPEAPELNLLKINKDEFKKAQSEDEEIKGLFTQASKLESVDRNKTYSIVSGILVRKREDRLGNVVNLLLIPKSLREQVKTLCHEGTSAHLGSTKSKDKLNRYFFWPNCYKDMDDFVRSCDRCQRAGKAADKKKAPLKLVPIIREVFSRINIDACGPLPLTSNGNRYLITAICMSSKFPEAIPVTDISSVKVTDALLNIFSHWGFPKEVQCDQGSSFTSALTTEFFERFGIKVSYSSIHHPQSNPVERFHRTLKRLLRALCVESGADWDKHLSSILLALRTVTHESTGYTPAELVYGKNLRTPETLVMEHWMEPQEENDLVTEYMFKLINRLKRCREVSIARMEENQIKRKAWYDKNAVKREFKDGDLVLVLATSKLNKLSVQWLGPGTVRKKISETNYIVEIPGKRNRTQIYHVNMLKPYYMRPEHVNLLVSEEMPKVNSDLELEIPYLENNSTVFDFREIVQTSELENKLTECQINQLQELLNQFSKCFSNEPGLTDMVEHDITLISDKPVRLKPYRTSQRQNDILKLEIQKMLKLGIIEIGESDYTSPMILVEVPGKDPRPCVDYRKLNEIIRTEYFPLPNIEERVEQVSSAKYITILDLTKGYWQIPLSKRAQRYSAFCTTFGIYRYLRMGFGLKNAPYFFSKLMSGLLNGYENFAVPYLDDVAVFSDTWEMHLKHLRAVLDRIKKANLTIKTSKCRFAQNHVKYLGHIVGNGSRSPSEAKIKCVEDFPTPKTKKQIRALLGLISYYGRYLNGFSVIAAPLTDALKGKTKQGEVIWTDKCEEAFQTLKKKLINKPILHSPDFEKEFIVQTDSSDYGMGVVLSQLNERGEEHPVLYLSKKFSDVEKRYGTTEKECASIVFAVKKLHYYLDGRKFKILTDHNPLVWLRTNASSNSRLMRWALALQPYDFTISHRSGKEHKNADSLSRLPIEE